MGQLIYFLYGRRHARALRDSTRAPAADLEMARVAPEGASCVFAVCVVFCCVLTVRFAYVGHNDTHSATNGHHPLASTSTDATASAEGDHEGDGEGLVEVGSPASDSDAAELGLTDLQPGVCCFAVRRLTHVCCAVSSIAVPPAVVEMAQIHSPPAHGRLSRVCVVVLGSLFVLAAEPASADVRHREEEDWQEQARKVSQQAQQQFTEAVARASSPAHAPAAAAKAADTEATAEAEGDAEGEEAEGDGQGDTANEQH